MTRQPDRSAASIQAANRALELRALRLGRHLLGLCESCGAEPVPGSRACPACAAKQQEEEAMSLIPTPFADADFGARFRVACLTVAAANPAYTFAATLSAALTALLPPAAYASFEAERTSIRQAALAAMTPPPFQRVASPGGFYCGGCAEPHTDAEGAWRCTCGKIVCEPHCKAGHQCQVNYFVSELERERLAETARKDD
jgi:hypothetical protein